MTEFRSRILIPLMIPVVGLIGVGIFVFAFSRVLLAVPKYWSVSLAILLAAELLAVGAIFAAVRRVDRNQRLLAGLLGVIVLIGGGVGLANGIRPIEHRAEPITIVGVNLAFEPNDVVFPVDTDFDLVFDNQDAGIPHNVAIASTDGTTVFSGEIFNGAESRVYAVPALAAGDYTFRCDVHPDMVGTAVASDEAGAEGGDGVHDPDAPDGTGGADEGQGPSDSEAPGTPVQSTTVVASDLAFDVNQIAFPADATVEVVLDNQDAGVPHNIAFYSDESRGETIAKGEIITGPAQDTLIFKTPGAGTYFFLCDVHPDMRGELVIT
ncbi:MAG: cupredoxin domain-containing protein [Actinomycetota bacterium]